MHTHTRTQGWTDSGKCINLAKKRKKYNWLRSRAYIWQLISACLFFSAAGSWFSHLYAFSSCVAFFTPAAIRNWNYCPALHTRCVHTPALATHIEGPSEDFKGSSAIPSTTYLAIIQIFFTRFLN